jgi:hypothetical protein
MLEPRFEVPRRTKTENAFGRSFLTRRSLGNDVIAGTSGLGDNPKLHATASEKSAPVTADHAGSVVDTLTRPARWSPPGARSAPLGTERRPL